MNIAIYSGSFNPLHIGHLAIIKHMIEEAGFDMVYLIVSPKNPRKDGISATTGQDRYNAALAAVNRHFSGMVSEADAPIGPAFPLVRHPLAGGGTSSPHSASEIRITGKVRVDDIELNMPEPHYTVRTLKALAEREPENTFTFVMGADNLADIRRWRDYTTILKDFGVAVFPRTGHDLAQIKLDLLNEDPAYQIQILDAPLVDISSTQIREAIANGEDPSKFLM